MRLAPEAVVHALLSTPTPPWADLYAAITDAQEQGDAGWLSALVRQLYAAPEPSKVAHLLGLARDALALVPGAVSVLMDTLPRSVFSASEHRYPGAPARRLAAYLSMTTLQGPDPLLAALPRMARDPLWHEVLLA